MAAAAAAAADHTLTHLSGIDRGKRREMNTVLVTRREMSTGLVTRRIESTPRTVAASCIRPSALNTMHREQLQTGLLAEGGLVESMTERMTEGRSSGLALAASY